MINNDDWSDIYLRVHIYHAYILRFLIIRLPYPESVLIMYPIKHDQLSISLLHRAFLSSTVAYLIPLDRCHAFRFMVYLSFNIYIKRPVSG